MEHKIDKFNSLTSLCNISTLVGVLSVCCLIPNTSFSNVAPINSAPSTDAPIIYLSDAELQQFLKATNDQADISTNSQIPSAFGQSLNRSENRQGLPIKTSYVGGLEIRSENAIPTYAVAQAGLANGPVISLSSGGASSKFRNMAYDNVTGQMLPVIGVNGARSDKPTVTGTQNGSGIKIPIVIPIFDKAGSNPKIQQIDAVEANKKLEEAPQVSYNTIAQKSEPVVTPTTQKSSLASTIENVANIANAISSVITPKDNTKTATAPSVPASTVLPSTQPTVFTAPISISEDLPPAIVNANGQTEDINSRRARGEYIKAKVQQEVDARLSSLVQAEVQKALATQGSSKAASPVDYPVATYNTNPIVTSSPVIVPTPTTQTVQLPLIEVRAQ